MRRDPSCTRCPLGQNPINRSTCVPGVGPAPARVMIVGEAPGAQEDRQCRPFVGESGEMLDRFLARAGIARTAAYVSNAVKCRPPANRRPTANEIRTCAQAYLFAELDEVRPDFILALGNSALYALTARTGITRARGTAVRLDQIPARTALLKGKAKTLQTQALKANPPPSPWIFPTIHPAAILHDDRNRPVVFKDIQHFGDILRNNGPIVEHRLSPILVDTPAKLEHLIDSLENIVSVDLETSHLYPWHRDARITAIGFGTRAHQFTIFPHLDRLPLEDVLDRIAPRLDDCFIIMQNGKFDALWLKTIYGFELRQDFDTMLAHYLLNENAPHDLEYLARLYFNAPTWDIPLAAKQTGEPIDQVLRYQAHDLFYTRGLFRPLNDDLHQEPEFVSLFHDLLMPLSNLFVQMEYTGTSIDIEHLDEVERALENQIRDFKQTLFYTYGKINWNSAKQVRELFFGQLGLQHSIIEDADEGAIYTPGGEYSTAETALNQYEHPAIRTLLDLRGAEKQQSVYVDGWRPFIVDGRLHPSYKITGTVTGRASAEHPNLHQTPRDPNIRRLVVAPPGWVLWEADLSQIELRLIAHAAQDPVMLQTYSIGGDLHWVTACSELARGGGGEHVEAIIRTAGMYCLQEGLPADRTSAEILREVWQANSNRQTTHQLLAMVRERRQRQGEEPRSRERRGAMGGEQPLLEWRLPDMAEQKIQEDLLRALRHYASHLSASQERRSKRLEPVQFADAMSLVSCLGASNLEKLCGPEEKGLWKDLRSKAKAINFGLAYGMGHGHFKRYAKDNYGITLTTQQAQESRRAFFATYPKLISWHADCRDYVRSRGFIRDLAGQRRRLPRATDEWDSQERAEAERQAINSPIQGFAAKINFMVLLALVQEFPQSLFRPVATVHDSILAYVKPNYVRTISERYTELVRRPPLFDSFDIDLTVPLEGEVKIGSWGVGVDLHTFLEQSDGKTSSYARAVA